LERDKEGDVKVLNLYAGIGGNRKLWQDVDVTAVELNPQIAKIYQDFFPNDKVIVADAHQYLLEHFKEYEFIWSSPPCPSHSRIRRYMAVERGQNDPIYPDMKLYQEVLLLKHYYEGKYVIENVIAFYEPLIKPSEFGNHWFWHNFHIKPLTGGGREHNSGIDALSERKGFNLDNYVGIDKKLALRNCVEPELGLHILNESKKELYKDLFK
jgi:DNA (cytosine-5)-methyltransferase 1